MMLFPTPSQRFLKQRKFLFMMPLLVLPFLVVIFIALGGGSKNELNKKASSTGFNLSLPDAHFNSVKEKDKLDSYEQDNRNAEKIRNAMKHDPYYKRDSLSARIKLMDSLGWGKNPFALSTEKGLNNGFPGDSNEKKVLEKLAQLKSVIQYKSTIKREIRNADNSNPDIERMQHEMELMKQNNSTQPDPELERINSMMDKLLLIQHPEKLEDSLKTLSKKNKARVYTVKTIQDPNPALDNGFYELSKAASDHQDENVTDIQAVVDRTQVIVSGATVKLRLLQDIYIQGLLVKKDRWLFGIAAVDNERLHIAIHSIRSGMHILPVSLEVYDLDGLEGIYIPGSINRDVSKQSANEAMAGIGLTNIDPSIGAQAASAGIQAAKSLMNKKIKLIRVSVKAGYQVLLKDDNQQ